MASPLARTQADQQWQLLGVVLRKSVSLSTPAQLLTGQYQHKTCVCVDVRNLLGTVVQRRLLQSTYYTPGQCLICVTWVLALQQWPQRACFVQVSLVATSGVSRELIPTTHKHEFRTTQLERALWHQNALLYRRRSYPAFRLTSYGVFCCIPPNNHLMAQVTMETNHHGDSHYL